MNKIEYALKLAKDCTYADEMTEGAKEFLRKAIDEALTEVLPQADVIKSACPNCKFEPMIKVNEKYNCEMCGYVEQKTVL